MQNLRPSLNNLLKKGVKLNCIDKLKNALEGNTNIRLCAQNEKSYWLQMLVIMV